jgi:hypothetical protein
MKSFFKLNWPIIIVFLSLIIYFKLNSQVNVETIKKAWEIFVLIPSLALIITQGYYWKVYSKQILVKNILLLVSLLIINLFFLTNSGYIVFLRNEIFLGYWLMLLLIAGISITSTITYWIYILLRR